MNRNVLIAITLVAVLACAVGYWWLQPSESTAYQPVPLEAPGNGVVGNAKNDKDPYDLTIVYSAEGFKPSEVNVKKGQRVRFLNKSKEPFWPAVGIHPTHTLYPERESTDCLGSSFDSCQDLKPDDFFDFTLNYVGEWPVHDHLHPFNTATITVTE